VEQLLLERVNDLRADPQAYGLAIGLNLDHVAPSPPLALNPLLTQSARRHAEDMADHDFVGHVSSAGATTGQRITATGYAWRTVAESLAASYADPVLALQALIEDRGIENLGHRRHLLAMDGVFTQQRELGVGAVEGRGRHANYYVFDTGQGHDPRPILTGVVYHDHNANGRYDLGEGLPGVTIQAEGAGQTTTFEAGGWSLPVNPGTYGVTVRGRGVPGQMTQLVAVGDQNVRLNFAPSPDDPQADAYVERLYRAALQREAEPWEVALWRGEVQAHGAAVVAEAVSRSHEARTRLVQQWYVTHLGRSAQGGEEQGWVRGLLAGETEERILAGILGSPEYLQRVGGQDADLVQAAFASLLGRRASPVEVAMYAEHILPSLGRAGAARMVLESQEFRTLLVRGFYDELLERGPEPRADEVQGWVGAELDLTRIRLGFLASVEFSSLGVG
jgi:hypothetical protein